MRHAMKAILPLLVAALAAGLVHAEELPAAALKLKEIREREINRINLAYLQKLDELLVDLRAKGDTEAVAAVEKLVAEAEGGKPAEAKDDAGADPLAPLVGVWRRDTDGGVWNIPNTKGGVFNGKLPFKLTYDPEKKQVVAVGEHWVDRLTLTSNPDVVYGSADNKGRKTRYRLERVK